MEGAHLGPYHILAELGSGGMGRVYRAEVTRAVAGLEAGAAVALKVIHPHLLEQEGFFKRFLREAEIGQAVEHANVVRCFDCDSLVVDGDRHDFLVMEYVEGQTLRDLLEELERVPEELCRHIGREIAKGLAAVHAAGAVHRDLKPENVLITVDHVVKVMDLGVARLLDEAVRLSQVGAFVGSLEYAAPEQFQADEGALDGRADLHALGVLLYELSTGQHPYRTDEPSDLMRRILDVAPRRAGEVNPQLSPFFEEVLHTLLAKHREERFASARELLDVLEHGEAGGWWGQHARELRSRTRRPLRRARIPRETALYGRDADLQRLDALFEMVRSGQGQVVLLEGEAGIGKTRLVDEFVAGLRHRGEDLNFLFGAHPPGGAATAAGAFAEAYREQFGREGLEETLGGYLDTTEVLIPAFAAVLRGESTPTGAEPLTKASLQSVFVQATRGLAAERPTIVLIDDLHFAPRDGRALFASLALAAPGHRFLLLGTMRPGLPEEWIANLERLDHATRLVLPRLGPKDLARLLQDAFRSERLADELGWRIAKKSDGNPFFVFELIRGLREGQFIAQRPDGAWITTRAVDDFRVPSSVLDLVNARVAGLDDKERNLLDVASCCGFEFDPLLVAGVLGTPDVPALQRLAKIEKRHRLVRSAGQSFVFDHHQVQEALYEDLPDPLRERYHAGIAQVLARRHGAEDREPGDLAGALCVALCEHALRGTQPASALRYLDAALDHLESTSLSERAVHLTDAALARPALLTAERRVQVLLRRAGRLHVLGRRAPQVAALAEARTLADEVGTRALQDQVDRAEGLLAYTSGDCDQALACFGRNLRYAVESGDRAAEAQAEGDLGAVATMRSRYEAASEHYRRQLALAEALGDRRGEARAVGNLGTVLLHAGQLARAKEHLERGLERVRAGGSREDEARASLNLGVACWWAGDHEASKTWYERCARLSREIGDRQAEVRAMGNLGTILSLEGRYRQAHDALQRTEEAMRELGDRRGALIAAVNLCAVDRNCGRGAKARLRLEEQLRQARQLGLRDQEAFVLVELARCALDAGDVHAAVPHAREALEIRRALGEQHRVVETLVLLGELHHAAEEPEEALASLDEAADLSRALGSPVQETYVLAVRACLPGGDPAAAEDALARRGAGGSALAVHHHLWRATGKHEHLVEAKRLLDERVAHARAEHRASMLENVRLHREILEAWATQGQA